MMLQLLNLLYFQISIINNTGGDQGETWFRFGSVRYGSYRIGRLAVTISEFRRNTREYIAANKARLERIN